MSSEVAEEYASSLSDLTINSKPLINMLTMLAEDNAEHASAIVEAVESHLHKVPVDMKLPTLYLIDSIVKNVGVSYTELFTKNIVNTFCSVFEKVDEKTRAQMFKLRQTWNEVFPAKKLYALDIRVQSIDPAWPVTASLPVTSIHVNPRFFEKPPTSTASKGNVKTSTTSSLATVMSATVAPTTSTSTHSIVKPGIRIRPSSMRLKTPAELKEERMKEILLKKQRELLELQTKKLELELLHAKQKLQFHQQQQEQTLQSLKPEIQLDDDEKNLDSSISITPVKDPLPVIPSANRIVIPDMMKTSTIPYPEAVKFKKKLETSNVERTSGRALHAPYRPKDPRLAGRQIQTQPDKNMSTVKFEAVARVKPEPASVKPEPMASDINVLETDIVKPEINMNYAYNNVNKEVKSVSRKDPRLRSNKMFNTGNGCSTEPPINDKPPVKQGAKVNTDLKRTSSPTSIQSRKLSPVKNKQDKPAESDNSKLNVSKVDSPLTDLLRTVNNSRADSKLLNSNKVNISESTNSTSQSQKVNTEKKRNDKKKDRFHTKVPGSKLKKKYGSPSRSKSSFSEHSSKREKNSKESKSTVFNKSKHPDSSQRSKSPVFKSRQPDSPKRSKSPHKAKLPEVSQRTKSPVKSKHFESPRRSKSPASKIKPESPQHSTKCSESPKHSMKQSESPKLFRKRSESPKHSVKHPGSPRRSARHSESTKHPVSKVMGAQDSISTVIDSTEELTPTESSVIALPGLNTAQSKTSPKKKTVDVSKSPIQENKFVKSTSLSKHKREKKVQFSEPEKRPESRSRSSSPESLYGDHYLGFEDGNLQKNYSYRERERTSKSPEVDFGPTAGDVDFRMVVPPQKIPRLTFQADVSSRSSPILEEEIKNPVVEPTKDVDFRHITSSPGKKRSSVEPEDQPAAKKIKAEIFDELFGSEDVDLRQLQPPVIMKTVSPPPPPIATAIVKTSPTHSGGSSVRSTTPPIKSPEYKDQLEDIIEERKSLDENATPSRSWAMYKENKPDVFKPMKDVGRRSVDDSPSPTIRREAMFNTLHKDSPTFDRLGRPLLYHRLPDDPDERKRSLNVTLGDTDMRRPPFTENDSSDNIDRGFNFNIIMAHADEQLKNGTITATQYNNLLKQVIQLNEMHKLQEAQRKEEQINSDIARRRTKRRNKDRHYDEDDEDDDSDSIRSPSFSPLSNASDTEIEKTVPAVTSNIPFGDVDLRFPVGPECRVPPLPSHVNPDINIPSTSGPLQPHAPWQDTAKQMTTPSPWEHTPPWEQAVPSRPIPSHAHMTHPPIPSRGSANADFTRRPESEYPENRWRQSQSFRPLLEPNLPRHNRLERFSDPTAPVRYGERIPPLLPPQLTRPPLRLNPLISRERDLPLADPKLLELIAQDTMKAINIDGVPREIRFYGETAIVMMDWDDPREISFQAGVRRVSFSGGESILLRFNDNYRDFILDGQTHRIRFGAPTRELYINGKWYESTFGGPPLKVEIGGKTRVVHLDGPIPQVKIGQLRRTDLVAGKINLIIDGKEMVPIFLDPKPQRFNIAEKVHIMCFIDALRGVFINGVPFTVEFGGLPMPIIVHGEKHFIRFSLLPKDVKPGHVKIINMENTHLLSPPLPKDEPVKNISETRDPLRQISEPRMRAHENAVSHAPALPIKATFMGRQTDVRFIKKNQEEDKLEAAKKCSSHISNIQSQPVHKNPQIQKTKSTRQIQLDMLASLMPTSFAPAANCSYQVEKEPENKTEESSKPKEEPQSSGIPFLAPEVNVMELFKKLVATGIVPHTEPSNAEPKKEDENKGVKEVDLKHPETLKIRQPSLISQLYSGIQCSSCGVRFPPEQTIKYSQHLDWHFRQNRRDRDNTRKAQSRKWYYDVSDWIQFEEIEDLEERAQSWFETQQLTEGRQDDEEEEVQSVPAGDDQDVICDVCHDKFEQFYNEEKEEWHLRPAVRIEDKTYHPVCYADYQASLNNAIEESKQQASDEKVEIKEEKIESKEESDAQINTEETAETKEITDEDLKVKEEVAIKEEITIKEEPIDECVENKPEVEPMDTDNNALPETESQVADSIKVEDAEANEAVVEKLDDMTIKEEHVEETKEEEKEEDQAAVKEELVEEESVIEVPATVDTTHAEVSCSIDGNVQFDESSQVTPVSSAQSKIKINIMKPAANKEQVEAIEPEASVDAVLVEPNVQSENTSSNVEESVLQKEEKESSPPVLQPASVKPVILGRKLVAYPPVEKGHELSGLCSIM